MMFNSGIYKKSPVWLQETMISARAGLRNAVREKHRFQNVVAEIERSQWRTGEGLRDLQWARVRALLTHAFKHVPYYETSFRAVGIDDISAIKTFDDIKLLPFLTKATVASCGSDLVRSHFLGPRFRINTSGTTGTPLVIYQDTNAIIRENAFIWRQLQWAGFRAGERRAWIRGDMVVPSDRKNPPFWRLNRVDDMLMMSSYHLSESSAADYLAALEQFDPALIQAYPSSVGFLARYLENSGRWYRGESLRAIVTTSETLTEEDREAIETRFGRRVFEHYGTAERVSMVTTCERGRRHINSDYGFTELVQRADGAHELVGTGFNNWLMPLVRYRSGDVVELPETGEQCSCGREFPVVKRICGRLDDYLLTPEGRRIGRLDHIFKGARHIAEAQIVQDSIDEVTVRVVPFGTFSDEDQKTLIHNAKERLGDEMRISIEIVSSIARTSSGKFRAVVRNVRV